MKQNSQNQVLKQMMDETKRSSAEIFKTPAVTVVPFAA